MAAQFFAALVEFNVLSVWWRYRRSGNWRNPPLICALLLLLSGGVSLIVTIVFRGELLVGDIVVRGISL